MVVYNLSHLNQPDHQMVVGPIQDDEALFLYSIVRAMRMKNILEVGGLNGYSAKNFLEAMIDGVLYTVDLNIVPKLSNNHFLIQKNAAIVKASDFIKGPLDLVFFDCHDISQMKLYHNLLKARIIDNKTIIALHDTNVHYSNVGKPKIHQKVEREMTNNFKKMGYDVFSLHPRKKNHSKELPFRHGVSICQRFEFLPLKNTEFMKEKIFI